MEQIFNDEQSAKYRQAVAILRELLQAEGEDVANRAFAEAVSDDRKTAFLKSGGVKMVRGKPPCFYRLKKESCPDAHSQADYSKCVLRSPIADHIYEFTKNGKTHSLVAQPYEITHEEIDKAVQFCKANDFRMKITASDSWHFPGKTLLVEFRRAGGS
jgi:hypothetical protein